VDNRKFIFKFKNVPHFHCTEKNTLIVEGLHKHLQGRSVYRKTVIWADV